jgi:hypothetical protein
MRWSSTVSVVTVYPIPVIQGAYEQFCTAPTPQEARYDQTVTYRLIALPIMRPLLATEPPVEDWLRFQQLVEQWQTERGTMSSITEAVLCPAYQSIIGMGELALPFIFAQLRSEGDEPDQWFWALKAITGADPVPLEDRGNYPRMSAAWLEWANQSA